MTTKAINKPRINIRKITDIVSKTTMDVIAETIITVVIIGVALAAISRVCPPVYASTIPGLYTFAMIAVLGIRITRHFDDSKTNNELSEQIDERFVELEQKYFERLDKIINEVTR